MPVALITGGSAGLGLALATELAARGWNLVLDARNPERLAAVTTALSPEEEDSRGRGPRESSSSGGGVVGVVGDVVELGHREELAALVGGGLDLLVNNASTIGPSPMPRLADYPLDEFRRVYEVNVIAPLHLIQLTLPALTRNHGTIVNVTSDAAVQPYEGWGGYGSSKAALNQLSAILATETGLPVHAFDPGDLRTELHQLAFPGEDISDRPEPASAVPSLLKVIGI